MLVVKADTQTTYTVQLTQEEVNLIAGILGATASVFSSNETKELDSYSKFKTDLYYQFENLSSDDSIYTIKDSCIIREPRPNNNENKM